MLPHQARRDAGWWTGCHPWRAIRTRVAVWWRDCRSRSTTERICWQYQGEDGQVQLCSGCTSITIRRYMFKQNWSDILFHSIIHLQDQMAPVAAVVVTRGRVQSRPRSLVEAKWSLPTELWPHSRAKTEMAKELTVLTTTLHFVTMSLSSPRVQHHPGLLLAHL